MGSIDFDSEPAYWYERTMRSSEAARLPIRRRIAIDRDEALVAREVRRHLDRIVTPMPGVAAQAFDPALSRAQIAHLCGVCQLRFTRAEWRQRRLWRSIYPKGGGRVDLYRHLVCPRSTRES